MDMLIVVESSEIEVIQISVYFSACFHYHVRYSGARIKIFRG